MRRFLLAAGFVLGLAPAAFAQCDTRFVLVNRSGAQVNEFYFGPSSNPNWGSDRLGQDVLPSGRQIMFDTGRPGPHDFRVVWSNGQNAQVMRINICATSQIIATPSGIEAR
jgi:hypothetical protein